MTDTIPEKNTIVRDQDTSELYYSCGRLNLKGLLLVTKFIEGEASTILREWEVIQ